MRCVNCGDYTHATLCQACRRVESALPGYRPPAPHVDPAPSFVTLQTGRTVPAPRCDDTLLPMVDCGCGECRREDF